MNSTPPAPETQERNSSTVKSFAVLELLASSRMPMSIVEIAEGADLNKTTARRYTSTLVDLGYVHRDENGRFRLTSRVLDLSSMYFRQRLLPNYAMPHLEKLCELTETTVNLAMLEDTEVVYGARVSHREVLSVGFQIGQRLPAHATAVGKVLLSFLPDHRIAALYPEENLPVFTSRTITTVTSLIGAVGEIRRQGFAVTEEEYEPNVCAVSCPLTTVDGDLIAAINIAERVSGSERTEFYRKVIPAVLSTAEAIAADTAGAGSTPV
jgi:IclR family pca regulon transcriptional regulator